MIKALFLDRDGVINIDKVHVYRVEDFEFSPGIFDLCKEYASQGFSIFVITNQAGIAKGLYTTEDFLRITGWMTEEFRKRGIEIAKVYYCPHFPDISGPCSCRKPAPGMILKAREEFDIDLSQSVLIGDKESDLESGRRAGIPESNLIKYSPCP